MTDRFEAWWTSNPARVALNPAAKEVARGIWHAARADRDAELVGTGRLSIPRRAGMTAQAEVLTARPRIGGVSYDTIAVDDVPDETPEDKGTSC